MVVRHRHSPITFISAREDSSASTSSHSHHSSLGEADGYTAVWKNIAKVGRSRQSHIESYRNSRARTHSIFRYAYGDLISHHFFLRLYLSHSRPQKFAGNPAGVYTCGSRAGKLETAGAQPHQSEVESHTTLPPCLKLYPQSTKTRIKLPPKAETHLLSNAD